MKLNILYLYPDLMNLYGEIGNIKAICHTLERHKIKPIVDKKSIDDEISFYDYDLIYIGSGTEKNRTIILKHLKKMDDMIKKAIEDKKFILATGNAYPLFGKTILDENHKTTEALEIFDYNESSTLKRVVKESTLIYSSIKKPIYGFENHDNEIIHKKNTLFENEGFHYNNFYGTYLIGPILIRNPEFLKHLIKKVVLQKYPKFKFQKWELSLEKKAYEEYIKFKQTKKHIK